MGPRVTKQHLIKGLKLECTASIGSVYWQSFQEKIPVGPRETPAAMSGNWWTGATNGVPSSFTGGKLGENQLHSWAKC